MKKITISMLALMLVASTAFGQIKSFNLKKGDVFVVEAVMDQDIEQNIMGQTQNIVQKITTRESLEVLEANGGKYKLRGITEMINIEVTAPMQGTTVMNSEGEGEMDGPAKALVGKEYFFYMNEYGVIDKFEGIDKMAAAIKEDMDKTVLGQMGQSEAMASFLNEETIRTTLGNLLSIYSTDGSKEWGYSNSAVVNNLPTEISATRSYDGNNTIMSKGTISVKGTTTQMGMEVSTDMAGTINTIYDLMDNGMPSKVQVQQTAEGKASTQGIDIPMVITVKSTSNVTKR